MDVVHSVSNLSLYDGQTIERSNVVCEHKYHGECNHDCSYVLDPICVRTMYTSLSKQKHSFTI